MAKREVPLRSVNMRPIEVRDGSILFCFGEGEEGGPGQADRKRRQAGAVSQPNFTQISAGPGGAGRGGSPALSRPHVPAPRVPLARGYPTRNPGTGGPAHSASRQSGAAAPPPSRPAPPRVRVLGWAANARWAGITEGRRKGNTRCLGDQGAELIM